MRSSILNRIVLLESYSTQSAPKVINCMKNRQSHNKETNNEAVNQFF